MIPVSPPKQNAVYGAGQPEYEPLPAHRCGHRMVVTAWRLSPEELAEVLRTGVVHLAQLTFGAPLQPIAVSVFPAQCGCPE